MPLPTSQPASLQTFTCFPRLPLELRCLIWEAMCQPRTVELEYDEDFPEGFSSRAMNPKVLEVCRESRKTVIDSYPLCFGSVFFPAKVRFNFAIDTLFIDNDFEENLPHLFSTFKDAEINGLKHLALEQYYVVGYNLEDGKLAEGLRRALDSLKSLKEVQVVFDIESLASSTLECGDEHPIELYDTLPKELNPIASRIEDLPTMKAFSKEAILWDGPCRPVYGWRRCPMWSQMIDDDYPTDEDQHESDGDMYPFLPGLRIPLFGPDGAFPMDSDSDIDSDMIPDLVDMDMEDADPDDEDEFEGFDD
ncbi:hypothetical protein BDZ45DRAFT_806109 [Acephala macrosclerotiorum]|nr:hypothetical protein BDZ45DRAFT_806109 [Acephala macrosclerotiorum]